MAPGINNLLRRVLEVRHVARGSRQFDLVSRMRPMKKHASIGWGAVLYAASVETVRSNAPCRPSTPYDDEGLSACIPRALKSSRRVLMPMG